MSAAVTRPRAPRSGTRSVSAHRRDALADQPLHVIERQQRAGKRKTIVGQLRHQRYLHRRRGRNGVFEQHIGDRLDVVEIDQQEPSAAGTGLSAGDRGDARVLRINQRLAVGDAVDFQLGNRRRA